MTPTEGIDEAFVFVKLRPKSFTKYIKCRKDIDRPGWFKCSNRLLEDDDLDNFSAAETCAWLKILSLASEQQSALVRINLLKINALVRKFTQQDLFNAIDKLKARGILKNDVTPTLRGRNVDVPQRGEERIGEEKNKAEEGGPESRNPPACIFPPPNEGERGATIDGILSSIPSLTMDAWTTACQTYGGHIFVREAALNALAFHGSRAESASWEISTWVSKINAAIEYAKQKAPALENSNAEPRPRLAPFKVEIAPLTADEVLSSVTLAAKYGLKLAGATIESQIAGSAS